MTTTCVFLSHSPPPQINSFFDWSKMQPAHAERSGNVYLCCCIPRGRVTVVADFDKGAYAAGETAQIKAVINNESKSNVGKMSVKLQRYIDLRDHSGAHKRLVREAVAWRRLTPVVPLRAGVGYLLALPACRRAR